MLAATLAATPLFAAVAKASPDQMFVISTPTAGVVDFRGTGSATFTNTQGSTDSVTIGSNSSIGVAATGSNSSDYTSSASASLDLAATTSLNHATGTASQAFNMMYNTATAASADTKLTDQVAKISSVSTTSTTADGSAVLDVLSSSLHQQAESKANEVAGSSSASGSGGTNGVDYGGDDNAWDAAWKTVYNEEYAKGYSAVNNASPTTYSHDLAVNGVGTIANVDAKIPAHLMLQRIESWFDDLGRWLGWCECIYDEFQFYLLRQPLQRPLLRHLMEVTRQIRAI